ncbi:hypothetical protein P3T36_001757 [Kitasatospora sp. MAP12-15]|uniref:hypothetical protein n=1 Tax=unclassified Kitasatospora TaxID=2633591 RepID=UPI002476C853|nr:hypothetical protein [Kitasatospora sp. MAP12-44]MDH6113363.1 hypothetical protein [Kitasatospora sp. MAP12-44]
MTESSAPFQAHKWLENHAVAMRAVEVGEIAQEDLVAVRVPITVTQTGPDGTRKAGVLPTVFYRLPDSWYAAPTE